MKTKLIILLFTCPLFSLSGWAQGRILTLLEANPDVRSVGMGHAMLGNSNQMHLYSNPAALVFTRQKLSADLAAEFFPKTEFGRLTQYNFSAGYKFLPHQAFFVGMRRQGGLSVPVSDGKTDELKPYEQTIDLGYAFALTSDIVVYASGSYVKSSMGTRAEGVALSVGAGYQKSFLVGGTPTLLTLGARLLDAGKPIKFNGSERSYSLPTSVAAGGEWAFDLSDRHRLTYALSSRAFVPKGAEELYVGTGLEYTYGRCVSVRLGYRYAYKAADCLTFGLGVYYKNFKLDAVYSHTTAMYGEDTFLIGVGFML
ncbi:PorV/PorQ family protein [Bacteroides sp. KG68]|uniref:PorV/PorQ family protein n=1 Tax=unclassified Bacteroides TaxID=2646097 RepID=UPI003D7F6691